MPPPRSTWPASHPLPAPSGGLRAPSEGARLVSAPPPAPVVLRPGPAEELSAVQRSGHDLSLPAPRSLLTASPRPLSAGPAKPLESRWPLAGAAPLRGLQRPALEVGAPDVLGSVPASSHATLFDVSAAAAAEEHAPPERQLGEVSTRAKRRATWIGGVMLALLAATYAVPGWRALRPWSFEQGSVPFWNVVGREFLGDEQRVRDEMEAIRELNARTRRVTAASARSAATRKVPAPAAPKAPASAGLPTSARDVSSLEAKPEELRFQPYTGHDDDSMEPKVPIENPQRLARFFEKLALAEMQLPGAIARVGHWGDSVLGNDGITSALRRRFQARFGDAGHGYHLLARYNMAYRHQGIRFSSRGQFRKCEIIFKCEEDGRYGYGGVTAASSGGGTAGYETTSEGWGSAVSRFELWFAKGPKGGKFQIKVDGDVSAVVNTFSDSPADGFYEVRVPDGPHSFEVRAIGDGIARGYGVVLERDVPGVVWDGLSLIGSFTQRLDYQEPAHLAAQIGHRDNDLLVFLLGGNDVQREHMDLVRNTAPYEAEYTRVLRKFRAGKPEASCLVMSVTDHGERLDGGTLRSRRIIPRLVAAQRKVADAEGCAFFDTFAAMGGDGAIVRWYRARPQLAGPDLAHPTTPGHEAIAELLYAALAKDYARFREELTGARLPEWWTRGRRPLASAPEDGARRSGAPPAFGGAGQ